MMRYLLGLLVCSATVLGAAGDIVSVSIPTNGWQALVTISGLATNGTFSMGYGASNVLSSPKLTLTVTSEGYDDTGTLTTIARTIYGTKFVRFPDPSDAYPDTSPSGGNVIVKVALSDFIYSDCSNITATISSGMYTAGGTPNNAASGVSVSNGSTASHARVVANWSMAPWQRITGDTFSLSAVAFHRSAQSGRPVRSIRFTAADESGHSTTNWGTLVGTYESVAGVVVCEYTVTMDASGLTQGDLVTCNFKAFPWVGNAAACLDTADGVNSQPTPLYAPVYLLCDRTGAYGVTKAIVDSGGGNDATGVAAIESYWATNSTPASFATIGKAAAAIAATNNAVHSRNDVGGGIIYLKTGNHAFTGSAQSYGNKPETWLTITHDAGLTQTDAVIHSSANNHDISDRLRFYDIKIDSPDDTTWDDVETMWFDTCYVDSVGVNNAWIRTVTNLYVTSCTIDDWGASSSSAAGIRPPGAEIIHPVLVRGNNMIGTMREVFSFTVLGNLYSGNTNANLNFQFDKSLAGCTTPHGGIIAFNKVLKFNSSDRFLIGTGDYEELHGFAIVQNVLENLGNGIHGLYSVAQEGDDEIVNNVMFWQNTLAGQRENYGYNQNVSVNRLNWSMKNVITFKNATKTDVEFADGSLIGNWPLRWGVGSYGNFDPEINGVSGAGSFISEWFGINSYQAPSATSSTNWFRFVDQKCFDGVTTGAGGGDYHLTTNSPCYNVPGDWILPYDLDGNARSSADPPGAYAVTTTYYVSTNGDNGNPGTYGSPFRTVQKGADVATAGETVIVLPGNYDEYVVTKANGTSGSPITFTSQTKWGARIKQFRFNGHDWNILSGFQVAYPSTLANGVHVLLDSAAHNNTITNCDIGPGCYVITTNLMLSSVTNSIWAGDVNFSTAGFVAGSGIFLGACGVTNQWFTNHDTAYVISSISADGHEVVLTGTVTNETRSNFWAFIYAGSGNAGYPGIKLAIGSGIDGPTNTTIVDNRFRQLYGSAIIAQQGNVALISGNTFTNLPSSYAIRWNGRNAVVEDNLFINNSNVLWYTESELQNITHPAGGDWFDYQVAHIRFNEMTDSSTNNIFRRNWIQNVENQSVYNQMWVSGGIYRTNEGVRMSSNVWVGVGMHGSASLNNMVFDHNMWVNSSYDIDRSSALALGATVGGFSQTNLVVTNNVFVNVGHHQNVSQEGSLDIGGPTTNPILTNNFATTAETMGWAAVVKGSTSNWFVKNGGDPVFRDSRNPLGADGLPFTDDDGLRPLASSPITLLSLGALTPYTNMAAHFSQTTQTTWQDDVTTNYSATWATNTPFGRGGPLRPYTTPEALGDVPLLVTFDASATVSGMPGATNWVGSKFFRWDFGDGGTALTPRPSVQHTYLHDGQVTVTLTVTNLSGDVASSTNVYRLLPKSGAMSIYFVSTSGNDTNAGTYAAPFLTIDHALGAMSAGDYVGVLSGDYNELLDCDRNIGSAGNLLAFVGYGATVNGFNMRYPYYTVEGFTIDGDSVAPSTGAVYLYEAADSVTVRNCFFDQIDLASKDRYSIYMVTPTGVVPAQGQLNCSILNNYLYLCRGISIGLHGSNHVVYGNVVIGAHGEADFIRPFGANHSISGNYVADALAEDGGHPDVFQVFGNAGYWAKDITIESNWFAGGWNGGIATNWAICQLEMNSAGGYVYTNQGSMTNIVVRNNIFAELSGAGSVDMDGLKFYNNLFYRCALNSGHVFAWGGEKGSALGTELTNNVFYMCGYGSGTNAGQGFYPPYNDQGLTNISLTADYNYVAGTNNAAKQTAPPNDSQHWGAYGTETHGVNGGDPYFANISVYDFRLLTNSPLANVGQTITSFSVDYRGMSRPQGASWDIGPFEGTDADEAGADVTPPVISAASTTPTSQTTATAQWTTDETCNTNTVTVWNAAGTNTFTASNGTDHTVGITGLTASTLYTNWFVSFDTSGNGTTNTAFTFTTLSATNDPTLTRVRITGGVTISGGVNIR